MLDVRPGRSFSLGATLGGGGVNFSLFSRSATRVELLFFDGADGARPSRTIGLDPRDQAYIDCQERVSGLWRDPQAWTRMSILNTGRMGQFSSDRSIRDYCEQVWHVKPVQVEAA